MLVYLKFDQ